MTAPLHASHNENSNAREGKQRTLNLSCHFYVTKKTMNTTPNSHLSQLSPTDPDLELYQWQKLADYSDSGFSHFYFRELSFSSEPTSILRKRFEAIVSVLGVMAALFLLGSAMWHHSPQRERWSPLVGERTEVEYLRTI